MGVVVPNDVHRLPPKPEQTQNQRLVSASIIGLPVDVKSISIILFYR